MLKTLAICHIIISSGTNGDWEQKYWHEMAHCNGWVHPHQSGGSHEAYKPPKKYLYTYPGPIDFKLVSLRVAIDQCDGHLACYWFDETQKRRT